MMAEKTEPEETKVEETKAERAIEAHINSLHDQRVDERSYPPR